MKKYFVLGMIVLFFGAIILPNISLNIKASKSVENGNDIYKMIVNKDLRSANTFSDGTIGILDKDENMGRLDNIMNDDIGDLDTPLFNITEIIDFGQTAWGLTSADFNGDDYMDFAVSWATCPFTRSTISIFYNGGNDGFTQDDIFIFYYSYIDDLDSGDYDNDGDIDLIFSYSEHDENYYRVYGIICMLFNDGDNNFGGQTMIAKRGSGVPYDPEGRINPHITSADYDMDNDIDLLVGDNSGKVEFYLNNGSGNFTSAGVIHDWGHLSWGLTSGDFVGDGDIDFLVAAETQTPYGYVYLKQNQMIESNYTTCFEPGPGEIINDIWNYVGTASLDSFDYNNDGAMDYVAGIGFRAYLVMNTNGTFNPFYICSLPENQEGYLDDLTFGALTTADYSNDGSDDLVLGGVQGVVRLCINKRCHAFITRPCDTYWYLFDKEQEPLFEDIDVLIIGKITVEVKEIEELQKVEFYINRWLRHVDTTPPYNFTWRFGNPLKHRHTIRIVAYNRDGIHSSENEIKIWRFL